MIHFVTLLLAVFGSAFAMRDTPASMLLGAFTGLLIWIVIQYLAYTPKKHNN